MTPEERALLIEVGFALRALMRDLRDGTAGESRVTIADDIARMSAVLKPFEHLGDDTR